jgi:nitrogen regulatory protein P-II 1
MPAKPGSIKSPVYPSRFLLGTTVAPFTARLERVSPNPGDVPRCGGFCSARSRSAAGIPMKKIEVLISPSQLDKVRTLLISIGIWELVVSDVVQYRKEDPSGRSWSPSETDHSELLKLELVTEEESVERVLAAFRSAIGGTRLNKPTALILPVEQSIRIRTSERGPVALNSRRGHSAAA